ncbi:hypothetical protein Q1695_000562 [Nippostrongylus brasiliensis]|nr:hypothetical protein Q1695_000562 [Nippostrongylus brasiliensis]
MTMLHQGRQTSVGDSSRSKSTVRRSIDLWRRRVSSLHINVPAHAIVFYQVIMMNNDMPTSVPDSTAKQIMRKCQVVMMNNDTPTSVTGVHSRLCPVVQHLTMMETTLLSKLLGDVKCQRLYMTLSSWYVESLEDYSHSMMAWDQQPATIVVTRSTPRGHDTHTRNNHQRVQQQLAACARSRLLVQHSTTERQEQPMALDWFSMLTRTTHRRLPSLCIHLTTFRTRCISVVDASAVLAMTMISPPFLHFARIRARRRRHLAHRMIGCLSTVSNRNRLT